MNKKRKKMSKAMAKAKARKRQRTLLMKECRTEIAAESKGKQQPRKKYTKKFNPEVKINLGRGLILTSTREEVLAKLS